MTFSTFEYCEEMTFFHSCKEHIPRGCIHFHERSQFQTEWIKFVFFFFIFPNTTLDDWCNELGAILKVIIKLMRKIVIIFYVCVRFDFKWLNNRGRKKRTRWPPKYSPHKCENTNHHFIKWYLMHVHDWISFHVGCVNADGSCLFFSFAYNFFFPFSWFDVCGWTNWILW